MKKHVILIVYMLTTLPILSVEVLDNTKTKTYNLNLSLGLASGGSIGIGRIQHFEKKTKEITYNFHYLRNSDFFVTGIYSQINSYRNKHRKGFFTLLMAGVDYTKGKEYQNPIFGIHGGPNESDYDKKKFEGIHPVLAIGCGYSFWLSQKSRILIYLDLGIKKTFSNLNVAISF